MIAPSPAPLRLERLGLVWASGADARAFLHQQLTCDVAGLAPGRGCLAAWCDPKGRVLHLVRLLALAEGFALLLPEGQCPALVAGLARFVLRSRVRLGPPPAPLTIFALLGEAAAWSTPLAPLGLAPPGEAGAAVEGAPAGVPDGRFLYRDGEARLLLALPDGEATAWPAPDAQAGRALGEADDAAWARREIEAGIPALAASQAGLFLPQMLNLEPLGGLSFQKGCYPGQEVVARTKYRGELKRRLYLLAGPPPPPAADTPLFAEGGGSPVGQVLRAAAAGQGGEGQGSLIQAIVQRTEAAAGGLRLGDPAGPVLAALPLPYRPADP